LTGDAERFCISDAAGLASDRAGHVPPDAGGACADLVDPGGYLLLPPVQANFNLPMIPAFDKVSIPNLSALFVVVAVLGRRIRLMPDSWIGRVLLVLFVISPLATMLTNTEFLRFGVIQLPGITLVPPESEGVPAGLPGWGCGMLSRRWPIRQSSSCRSFWRANCWPRRRRCAR
jgi:hypothetical protein